LTEQLLIFKHPQQNIMLSNTELQYFQIFVNDVKHRWSRVFCFMCHLANCWASSRLKFLA